jgi:hypothetical protein
MGSNRICFTWEHYRQDLKHFIFCDKKRQGIKWNLAVGNITRLSTGLIRNVCWRKRRQNDISRI